MMTAESMLSKRPVLKFTIKVFMATRINIITIENQPDRDKLTQENLPIA